MKSWRSGLEPVISRAEGSMETAPCGRVVLVTSAEPIIEARVAWRRTYGALVSVNVNRR
jgi:hypothetical protein